MHNELLPSANSDLVLQIAVYNPLVLMSTLSSSSLLNYQQKPSGFLKNPQKSQHQNMEKNCLFETEEFKMVDLKQDFLFEEGGITEKDSPNDTEGINHDKNKRNNKENFFDYSSFQTSLATTSNLVESCDQNKLSLKG